MSVLSSSTAAVLAASLFSVSIGAVHAQTADALVQNCVGDLAGHTISADTLTSSSGITIARFVQAFGEHVGLELRQTPKLDQITIKQFNQGFTDSWTCEQQSAYQLDDMAQLQDEMLRANQSLSDLSQEQRDSLSYFVGYSIGFGFASSLSNLLGEETTQVLNYLDAEEFLNHFTPAYADNKGNYEASKKTVTTFMKELEATNRDAQSKANLARSEDFLQNNVNKKDIQQTESGLQYQVLTAGEGTPPNKQSTVTVHYSGTLLNGTEFDSSYKRNQPAEFPVSGVIPGWTEGLQLMAPGSKYRFFIPPNLAYGERGAPPSIGSNELLIFEVELLSYQ